MIISWVFEVINSYIPYSVTTVMIHLKYSPSEISLPKPGWSWMQLSSSCGQIQAFFFSQMPVDNVWIAILDDYINIYGTDCYSIRSCMSCPRIFLNPKCHPTKFCQHLPTSTDIICQVFCPAKKLAPAWDSSRARTPHANRHVHAPSWWPGRAISGAGRCDPSENMFGWDTRVFWWFPMGIFVE